MPKKFSFSAAVKGSGRGFVYAESKAEARRLIADGEWDEINVDVDEVEAEGIFKVVEDDVQTP